MICQGFCSDHRYRNMNCESVFFDAFLSKKTSGDLACSISKSISSADSCSFTFTGIDPRKGWRTPLDKNRYSEQRDEETSYGYFGARYMDHELMTMWLSVDPMADKYPSISPYAYCAWTRPTGGDEHRWIKYNIVNNPVRLVDPDGYHIEVVANNNGTYTVRIGQVNNDKNIYTRIM